MKVIKVLGIDLAKNIFQLHGCDALGHEVLSKKVSRKQLMEFMRNLKPCVVGMEACGGAHYWGRAFKEMGHEVRLVSPQYVKPYVRGNKTDRNDARAIAECVSRPGMRFVALKSLSQQEVQMLHCVRNRLVKNRVALSNEIRGMLAECGIVIPVGFSALKKKVLEIIGDAASQLSGSTRALFLELQEELLSYELKIKSCEKQLIAMSRENESCRRLLSIPGVGPITATAVWSHIGNALLFKNGRQFAAYLGLVPREHSSGGKQRLMGITKRGDKNIRRLLVHGARALLRHSREKTDHLSLWMKRLDIERGRNKACVAIANKNARVIWALMSSGREYIAARAA